MAFAETFRGWSDFPKGLSVLVMDSDTKLLQDIQCQLESHHYVVTCFSEEEGACAALASQTHTFHVAVVEATVSDGVDSSKVLAFSRDVPIVMMSVMENMSMMVKSIALGAVEFVLKPLSEDKLKNLWQHVVRKALDSSTALPPGYLAPRKPLAVVCVTPGDDKLKCSTEARAGSNANFIEENHRGYMVVSHGERLADPLTPQLEQSGRMASEEDTLDESPRSHNSTEVCNYTERLELRMASEVKKEEDDGTQTQIFCCPIPMLESALSNKESLKTKTKDVKLNAESPEAETSGLVIDDVKFVDEAAPVVSVDVCEMSSTEDNESLVMGKAAHIPKETPACRNGDSTCLSESSNDNQNGNALKDESKRKSATSQSLKKDVKCSKKKLKIDWTADLHRRFVQAVEYLGVEKAIPSTILELMKVDGLTRHNIASHLQKYRSNRKHIYVRDPDASTTHQSRHNHVKPPWSNARQKNANQVWIQPRPQILCPPMHAWGYPRLESSVVQGMQECMGSSIIWQANENCAWEQYLMDACVPGVPIIPPWHGPYMTLYATPGCPQGESATTWGNTAEYSETSTLGGDSLDKLKSQKFCPNLLEATIQEALANPLMPLPLGLKPPSIDSVVAELQRQGIDTSSSFS